MKASSFAVLAMAMAVRAHSQTYWTGTGSDNWNDNTSWSTGIQPTSTDDVYVGYNYGSTTFSNPGSLTLNITANAFANNLYSQSMLNLNSGATLTLGGNLMTTSTFTFGIGTASTYLAFTNPATLSGTFVFNGQNGFITGGTGTLNIAAGSFIDGPGNGTLNGWSILNQGVITSDGGGQIALQALTFDNNGTIDNTGLIYATDSSTVNITADSFQNTRGMLAATDGGNLIISATTFNNVGGSLAISDSSTVTITGSPIGGTTEGSFNNAGSFVSVKSGSTLNISSNSFDNTGGTLWAQDGSTIEVGKPGNVPTLNMTTAQLGTLRTSDTSQIILNANIDNSGNTLNVGSWGGPAESIVLEGTLNNGKVAGNSLAFLNGTANNVEFLDPQTLTGELNISGTTQFDAPVTINSGGKLVVEEASTATWNLPTNITLNGGILETPGTLNINPGTTIAGDGDLDAAAAIVNQGSILANGGGLSIGASSFENQGTIVVSNANTLGIGGGTFDNSEGTISAEGNSNIEIDNSCTTSQLGTLSAADTSHIYLNGSIDNTGNTLPASAWGASGSVVLEGTLKNGKVAGSIGFQSGIYQMYPTVQNVEFESAEAVGDGVTLLVADGAKFDGGVTIGAGSQLYFLNSEILANNVTFGIGNGTYSNLTIERGTLTVESSATVDGPGYNTINGGGRIDNQGSIVADGVADMYIQTASLENEGNVGVAGNRTLNVSANFIQDSTGDLSFILNSNTQYGVMDFTGTAALAGNVDVSLLAGYTPTVGTEWDILNFSNGYTGTLTAPTGYELIYNTDSITLEETAAPDFGASIGPAVTPEPKSFLVLAAGGLCVFFKRRRQRMSAV